VNRATDRRGEVRGGRKTDRVEAVGVGHTEKIGHLNIDEAKGKKGQYERIPERGMRRELTEAEAGVQAERSEAVDASFEAVAAR
jgi:hypothetical protein